VRRTTGFTAALAAAAVFALPAGAQSEYRNLEAGRPVRISDATPTERGALDLDLTTFRFERLSLGRYRMQYEPRIAYGMFPRTEISLRASSFYRERSVSPRGGVAGVGVGAEYQLVMEGPSLPAIALAGEAFIPTGPNAIQTAVSLKGLVTRSFAFGRIHLNGSYGTFAVRKAAAGPVIAPPVIDGPCTFQVPDPGFPLRSSCSGISEGVVTAAASSTIATKARWTAGAAIDKSFARRSILIVADVFTEKFEGIGRQADWSAEGGARKQVNQFLVVDAGFGRRFSGISPSWFATIGTTLTLSAGL
jgi:hypothetical protein